MRTTVPSIMIRTGATFLCPRMACAMGNLENRKVVSKK